VRARGFAATATITLAVGIGLSTAVFTVADALWIRRLPIRDQDRLIALWGETPNGQFANYPLDLQGAREFGRRAASLEQTAFFAYEGAVPAAIRDGDRVYRLRRALVSGNFFDVLGAGPELGRMLRAEDDVAGAAPVVVISHRAWQEAFGGDPRVVGRSVVMFATGRAYTIVGVMPRGLEYPEGAELWAPVVASSTGTADSTHLGHPSLDLMGRLRAGASAVQAREELTRFFRTETTTRQLGLRGVAHSLPDLVLGDAKPALAVVAAAAAVLLLVTCVNVANLLLVRALGRAEELVVRSALGASGGRIMGDLLVENTVLSVVGGLLGVAFAFAAVKAFVALAPRSVPRLDEIGVNGAALLGAIGITAVATILCGLAPAVLSSRVDAQGVLRSGGRHGAGRGIRALTEALVVGQIALAVVVLSAAGLMTKSLVALQRIDLSFEPSRLYVAELALRGDRSSDARTQLAAVDAVLRRVRSLPGVTAASPVLTPPFSGTGAGIAGRLSAPDQTAEQIAGNPMLNMEIVAPDYFTTLGIPVVRGRAFTADDREGAPNAIVVSQSTARHYWPASDPVGQRLTMADRAFTVVGVVPDTRYRALRIAAPSVYFPIRQSFFPVVPTTLLIRSRTAPAALLPELRRAVGEADAGVTVASTSSFAALLDEPRAQPRLNALLLGIFAAAVVSLAAIGLFAVIATMLRRRTRELGIRMALGATPGSVGRMMLLRGAGLAVAGAAIGIGAALALNRFLASLLFHVSPTDPAMLVSVVTLMLVVAALASLIPARASMGIDPAIALRSEA